MGEPNSDPRRDEFLLKMYEQMFNNINRHIMITWEVVPVVGGALGVIALTSAENVSVPVAASLIILLAGWLCAHSLDANEWVKRNLFIISNIERQFLKVGDSEKIHYYFKLSHEVTILRHFQIQIGTALVIAVASVMWGLTDALESKNFPGIVLATFSAVALCCWLLNRRTNNRLRTFKSESPGMSQIK